MDGESQEQLVSKIQYKNFEPGEFTDRQERTCAQTIALIEQFPWETERDHLVVSLTNPSITIEGRGGDFLKLALYYNGKFVLHYLKNGKHLYTKSLIRYQDAYPYIQTFFAVVATPFDPQDLKEETSWMESRLPHFADGNFQYIINFRRCLRYGLPGLFTFAFVLFLEILLFVRAPANTWLLPFILFFPVLAGSSIYLVLLANHYRRSRDLVLILSKGTDLFYYGPIGHPETFDKKNILDITTHGRKGRYKSYDGILVREEINFTDGRSVNISSMLIDHMILLSKLPGIPLKEEKETFPFISIPPSAAIPS